MESTDLDVESLLREASERAGLDDFGSDHFMGVLRAWCHDLESDRLTGFGRTFLRRQAVNDLTRRLRVLDTLRRHPEIDDVRLPPIVWIIGPARSGTTLLHNLLACHRGGRAMLRWELVEPLPPPEAANYATDPRIDKVQQKVERLRGTQLEEMHWVEATDPEECAWGLIDLFGTMGNGALTAMPTTRRHLTEGHERAASFREYRRVLKLLLWRNPAPSPGFLVLKAPQFLFHLRAAATENPEASFVITHRDPFRTLTSTLAIMGGLVDDLATRLPGDDQVRIDDATIDNLRGLRTMIGYADDPPAPMAHVRYADLVADPTGAAMRALTQLDAPDDPALAASIDAYLNAQRAGRRKNPPASLPTFGLDQDEMWADPTVQRYAETFGVAPERERVVDVSSPGS